MLKLSILIILVVAVCLYALYCEFIQEDKDE